MEKQTIARHAVVIGASIGGLMAARVLADYFGEVTVLERDPLPPPGQGRKGVPQGQHAHGLLGRGREAMEQLFPGLTADLVGMGALSGDTQQTVRWYGGGGALAGGESGLVGLAVSRPLLEGYIRQRLASTPGVRFVENCEVLGLQTSPNGRQITGVLVVRRTEGSTPHLIAADWVVDASGRGSQSPKWLETLGYEAPEEEAIRVGIGYATAHFRRDPGEETAAVVVAASPASPRSAALIAQEGGRWVLSLGGFAGDHPPTDLAGFAAYAQTLPSLEIHQVVRRGELVGSIVPFKYPASLRRRYERLGAFPQGYLVFGDAVCSFNPVYGQGMTSAALQALALHAELKKGGEGLAPRFFRAASRVVDIPWEMAAGSDLNHPGVEGKRTPKMRLVNWYLGKLFPVAWRDPAVARAFIRVTNLVAPPPSLMAPATLLRVLWGNLRPGPKAAAEHGQTAPAR